MNSANHQMNCVSTYPFYIFPRWEQAAPQHSDLPYKGDTVIGNDVWIGQNATILPGVHIGDGAIIGMNSVVGSDVAPYCIVAGNPAHLLRKRFDDSLIALLEQLRWWDLEIEEIKEIIPLLSCSKPQEVEASIRAFLENRLR